MKEDVTRRVMRCTKCGEPYEHYRGVSDTRCESCWDDEPTPMHQKVENEKTDRTLQP